MWIDDRLVYDFVPGEEFQIELDLTGKPQKIRVDYVQLFGRAGFKAYWTRPKEAPEEPLPASVLFHELGAAEKAGTTER